MKKSTTITLLLASLLLTMDIFAQSEYEPSTVKLKNNVGNSITVPSLPDKKNLTFGGKFTGKEDGFVFGIIADRTGGNPIIGWPYFEQAIRDMNVLHPDFVIMPGDLVDSYIPLILPMIANPATVFFLRQYLLASFPKELVNAARIDGASEIRTFHTIALPILKPALATMGIFAFVGSWNNFLMPLMLISNESK